MPLRKRPTPPQQPHHQLLTSSVLAAGREAIAAQLPEMAGVGSLIPIAKGRRYIVDSDEPLSAFLELEPVRIRQWARQIRLNCVLIRAG